MAVDKRVSDGAQRPLYHCQLRPIEGGKWECVFPDVPGCQVEALTREEALRIGAEALDSWLAEAQRRGFPLPEPGSAEKASGQFRLRVPKSIHRRLFMASSHSGVSINQLAVHLLLGAVARWKGREMGASASQQVCDWAPVRRTKQNAPKAPQDFSGAWVLRLPRELHLDLQWVRVQENVSLNLLINALLAAELGRLEAAFQGEREVPSRSSGLAA